MEIITVLTVVLCVIVSILLYLYLRDNIPLPSPHHVPLVGNIIHMKDSSHLTVTKWAKEFGNLFCLTTFKRKILIINGYDAVYEFLYTKGRETAGRGHGFRMTVLFAGEQNDLIFTDFSPKWKKLRGFVHHNLKQYGHGMDRIENISLEIAKDLVAAIKKDSISGIIDPYDCLYLTIVNVISCLITGKKYVLDDPVFKSWFYIENTTIKYGSLSNGVELEMFPWLRFFGNFTHKMIKSARKELESVYNILKTDFETNRNSKEDCLINALLSEMKRQENDNDKFLSDPFVINILFDLLIAGTATTTSTMYAALLLMAGHRHIQEKISQEICALNSENICLDYQENMPYTRACILELHRYSSVVAFGLLHKTLCGTVIQGVKIPKGTRCMTNLWGVLHDEKFWDRPFEFVPERFLDENGQLVLSDHPNRRRMLAFGTGPRMCLGQGLANARIFILLTSIIKNFRIEKVEGEEFSCDCRELFKFGVTLEPKRSKLKFVMR